MADSNLMYCNPKFTKQRWLGSSQGTQQFYDIWDVNIIIIIKPYNNIMTLSQSKEITVPK